MLTMCSTNHLIQQPSSPPPPMSPPPQSNQPQPRPKPKKKPKNNNNNNNNTTTNTSLLSFGSEEVVENHKQEAGLHHPKSCYHLLKSTHPPLAAQPSPATHEHTYHALLSFQSRLRNPTKPSTKTKAKTKTKPSMKNAQTSQHAQQDAREYGSSDDDTGWWHHRLHTGTKPLASDRRKILEEYEVIDPRHGISQHKRCRK